MASTTCVSSVLFLLAAFTAGASAATFTIKNNCGYTGWPAGIPVGGGTQLDPGQTYGPSTCPPAPAAGSGAAPAVPSTVEAATATAATTLPPATLAEYTIGGTGNPQDYYDISVVDGYNQPMAFSCSTGVGLVCTYPSCPDAYQYPTDDTKTHSCSANSNYQVTFCP
ncbi:unnamed protein product [Miscanthus lutarioriparius]|uniref:Thaumatin-like protein n=1 Tax=Miscanthus lutarioriparius TaxID=422564 RepID=A0A811RHG0_9POAL|nr:unnamed protein product [Miscanthus lutarioriparius]